LKLPMLVGSASRSGATIVFINQVRDKINVKFGQKTTTPGGRTLKFFASLRIKITRVGYYQVGGETVGIRVELIPVKSKQFPIFNRVAKFIIGPNGIDVIAATLEMAITKKVVGKKGSWYNFQGLKWQGVAPLEKTMREDPAFLAKIEAALAEVGGQTSKFELKPIAPPAATVPAAAPPPAVLPKPVETTFMPKGGHKSLLTQTPITLVGPAAPIEKVVIGQPSAEA